MQIVIAKLIIFMIVAVCVCSDYFKSVEQMFLAEKGRQATSVLQEVKFSTYEHVVYDVMPLNRI
jgi:hypothetical protein